MHVPGARAWYSSSSFRFQKQSSFTAERQKSELSEFAFLREASFSFEEKKVDFRPSDAGPFRFLIESGEYEYMVKIPKEDMIKFFEPVINENIAPIEAMRTKNVKSIIVLSGFGNSLNFQAELKKAFGDLKIFGANDIQKTLEQAVSHSALLRHKETSVRNVPSNFSLGITQIDKFDPKIHPDGLLPSDTARGGILPPRPGMADRINHDIVDRDGFYGENIVRERWLTMFPKGAIAGSGNEFVCDKWQRFLVAPGESAINFQVYWTELDIQDHDTMRTGKDATSDLREGIEPWGDPIVLQLPNLEEAGFVLVEKKPVAQEHEDEDEEPMDAAMLRYELDVQLVMTCDGANISVKGQIAAPDNVLFTDDAELATVGFTMLDSEQVVVEIWEQDFNPSAND